MIHEHISQIKFEDRFVNDELGTTTLYFIAPKAMLGEKYPEAISMEISVELPTDHPEARYASVAFSPTKYDRENDCYCDYDWYDVELTYEEIEQLLAIP